MASENNYFKMEKKELSQKLKETISKKDSRFWLMIFVVTATVSVLGLWAYDIKNTYSVSANWGKDSNELGISEVKSDASETIDQLFSLFDKSIKDEGSASSTEELGTNTASTTLDLDQADIDKLKLMLEVEKNKASSTNTDILASSSVPSLYPELDDSEKTIQDLKRRIEELEGRLD